MALSQARSKRKSTGGRYKDFRKKRHHNMSGLPSLTRLEERRVKVLRARGGNLKRRLLSTNIANIYDPQNKKYQQAKIKTITDNPANRHFIRRNIMTKGTIIDTEMGKAKVTSRPGQDGIVNAVLVK